MAIGRAVWGALAGGGWLGRRGRAAVRAWIRVCRPPPGDCGSGSLRVRFPAPHRCDVGAELCQIRALPPSPSGTQDSPTKVLPHLQRILYLRCPSPWKKRNWVSRELPSRNKLIFTCLTRNEKKGNVERFCKANLDEANSCPPFFFSITTIRDTQVIV